MKQIFIERPCQVVGYDNDGRCAPVQMPMNAFVHDYLLQSREWGASIDTLERRQEWIDCFGLAFVENANTIRVSNDAYDLMMRILREEPLLPLAVFGPCLPFLRVIRDATVYSPPRPEYEQYE